MDGKELKTALKNAREAIRAKEYKEALKHCKSILKHEKSNYNALVFVGVAAEGLEQEEQAIMAYSKATQVDPQQQLAWQGLCSFYEKCDKKEHLSRLSEVYTKLMAFQQEDVTKYSSTNDKLVAVYKRLQEWQKVADTLQLLLETLPAEDITGRCRTWSDIIAVSRRLTTPAAPVKIKEGYQFLLENVVEEERLESTWIEYIKCLLEKEELAEVRVQCAAMLERLPSAHFPASMLAQLWLDTHAAAPFEAATDEIGDIISKLPAASAVHHTVTAVLKAKQGAVLEAKLAARQGARVGKKRVSGWAVYALCASKARDLDAVDKACKAAVELMRGGEREWLGGSTQQLEAVLILLHAESLHKARQHDRALEVIASQKDLSSALLSVKLSCLVDQGALDAASALLEDNKALLSSAQLHAWAGWLAYHKGELDTARERLEASVCEDSQQAAVQQWLARVHWQAGNPQQALTGFLTAAKLDPQSSESFLYLGLYYQKFTADKLKSSKCLQRAFDLDASNEAAGAALVDGLMEQGDTERCLSILATVTSRASAGSCKWGWLRLGLTRLRTEDSDPTVAIMALQSALRADQQDAHVWECLGEAYMKRGSHTAALKAFTRATELNPDSLYCFYQLACIEQSVGEYAAAVRAYEEVLGRRDDYVPALVGVAQTLLLQARGAMAGFVHGRALGYCQRAAAYLTQCAVLRPDMSCVWKLLADVFSITHLMPAEIVRMYVSSKLLRAGGEQEQEQQEQEQEEEELSKAEVLALASRCYAMAIKQQPTNSMLWQDLGLSYWREGRGSLLAKCIQCLHKAVALTPNNHEHWLALGTVLAQKQVNNKALAQHCYIKSLQLETNNVCAWTHLGVLYSGEGNVRAANEAFRAGQAVDPEHVAGWLGQAMLAETVAQDVEAMDLFRHATQLDNHVEGSLGYANSVVSILHDPAKLEHTWNKYVVHEMAAVPAASDAMDKYTERIRNNPTAYNLWGLLLEQQGLYSQSCRAFAVALTLLDNPAADLKRRSNVMANYARSLRSDIAHAA